MPVISPSLSETAQRDAWRRATQQFQRTLKLTERWTPLIPHPIQAAYFWHPSRFKVNPSGRRSGKTELAKRKGVMRLIQKNAAGGPRNVLFGAPTRDQAKQIFWEDLQKLIPQAWVAKTNETLLEITTHWGSRARVMGMERPQRVEGKPWDDMFLDEIADYRKKNCIETNILPALGTRGRLGGADFLGVPDEVGPNQAEYEKYWEMGLRYPNKMDLCAFHWPSSDIMDASEITARKEGMDEYAFKQEYGGAFVRSGGKAVPQFDPRLHVSDHYTEYCQWLPLDWSCDFGTNVGASILAQSYRNHVWIMDEIVIRDTSTKVVTAEFIERMNQSGYSWRHIRIFGDAAGRSPQSNIGTSDYEIMAEMLPNVNAEWFNLTHNPLVKDTVNVVRSRFVNANNEINLWINKRCKELIKDVKTAAWPSDLKQNHVLAALRYYLWKLYGEPDPQYQTAHLGLPAVGGRRAR